MEKLEEVTTVMPGPDKNKSKQKFNFFESRKESV